MDMTLLLSTCAVHDGGEKTDVTNKEELHRSLPFLAKTKSQATSFVAYNWTPSPSNISPT